MHHTIDTEAAVAAVFAYGTLRSGQPNLAILDGLDFTIVSGHVDGLQLHNARSFPYATPADGRRVIGDLLTFEDGHHLTEALTRLDYLEGYYPTRPDQECHYLRRIVTATTVTGQQLRTFIYIAGPRTQLHHLPVIDSGDWLNH